MNLECFRELGFAFLGFDFFAFYVVCTAAWTCILWCNRVGTFKIEVRILMMNFRFLHLLGFCIFCILCSLGCCMDMNFVVECRVIEWGTLKVERNFDDELEIFFPKLGFAFWGFNFFACWCIDMDFLVECRVIGCGTFKVEKRDILFSF